EIGEPTVFVDPGKAAVGAVHVVAAPAALAEATGNERVHDDGVADLDIRDARSDLVDPAGVLVTKGVGQGHARLLRPLPLLNVEIGAAEPGGADPHDHVERVHRARLV